MVEGISLLVPVIALSGEDSLGDILENEMDIGQVYKIEIVNLSEEEVSEIDKNEFEGFH